MTNHTITIVGAGLAGSLLAVFLARRGFQVQVFERLPDMRSEDVPSGRSINLALAERGIDPLRQVGLYERVSEFAIPMRGRMVHPLGDEPELQPYGTREHEVIFAAHRARLNEVLLDAADAEPGVTLHFEHKLTGGDLEEGTLEFRDENADRTLSVRADPVIGADGAASALRGLIGEATGTTTHSELLDHGYKELTIPPGTDGGFRLDPNALHIWPRGGYMLIALPNTDRSFTATLFLPKKGDPGFDQLDSGAAVRRFFERQFPDVVADIPDLQREFHERPTGVLGTVHCPAWHLDGRALVLGDAAHAIVPFHGQGMNCAFEDCQRLDAFIEEHGDDWSTVFDAFESERRPDAEAIATMALENYEEMRDSVRDPKYKLKRELERQLERHHPDRFVPRYSMVMFHRLPYREALKRGRIQTAILDQLTRDVASVDAVDMDAAERLVRQHLKAFPESLG